MKKIIILFLFAICLTFAGCGRINGPVKEVNAFADEKEDVLSQFSKILEANPTEAGVDEARKIFEAKKDSLKAKKEAIDAAPQGINSDWRSLLVKTEDRHDEMLQTISVKFGVASKSEQGKKKWDALEKDFKDTVKRY
jgi:hypothetical protein